MHRMNLLLEQELDQKGFLTTARTLELGFSKQILLNYVKKDLLERVRQGVYVRPGAEYDELYTMVLHSDFVTFSHDSALYLNGLLEAKPPVQTITIPSGRTVPGTLKESCICYYIKPELYDMGAEEIRTGYGNPVRAYNAERTVCDFLRSRNRCDEEMVIKALKNYAGSEKKYLNRLSFYARQLHVEEELDRCLKLLL